MRQKTNDTVVVAGYTLVQFLFGAAAYAAIEVAWRGWTHPSMALLGGICFCILGALSRANIPLILRCVLGVIAIVSLEYLFGFVLNILLGLDIWNYSHIRYSLHGQICLRYTVYWLFLTLPAFVICSFGDRVILGKRKKE